MKGELSVCGLLSVSKVSHELLDGFYSDDLNVHLVNLWSQSDSRWLLNQSNIANYYSVSFTNIELTFAVVVAVGHPPYTL